VQSLLFSLIQFFRRPELAFDPAWKSIPFGQKIWLLYRLIALQLVLVGITTILSSTLASTLGFKGENLVGKQSETSNVWQFLVEAAIWALLAEELFFRGWISKSRVIFGILFPIHALVVSWIVAVYALPLLFGDNSVIFIWTQIGLSLAFIIGWIIKMTSDTIDKKPLFATLKPGVFTTIIWYSAVLFGFAHSSNWIEVGQLWYLIPLLVIPQLIGGISLAFTRVRLGLQYSILGHFILNLLGTILIYNSLLVDEANQNSPSLIIIYGLLIHICVSAVLEIRAYYHQKNIIV